MEYVDPDTLLKALEDLNKQILELRSEISYIKGYITSMNNHQYPPITVPPYQIGDYPPSPQPISYPPYKEPNWPNQTWMSTNNHPNEMQPCTKSYNQD